MSTLVIGSSNLKRFYVDLDENVRKNIEMQKCTTIEAFRVRMEEIDEDDRRVIISVIENFVCEHVEEAATKEENEIKVTEALDDFVNVLRDTARKLPETKFAVVAPMKRPALKWYTEALPVFTALFTDTIKNLSLLNVEVIGWDFLPVQTFDKHGVHLVPEAGKRFWTALLALADHFFEIPAVDLDEEMQEVEAVASGSNVVTLVTRTASARREDVAGGSGTVNQPNIQEQINEIKKDTKTRRHNDSMVTARIREELDHMINVKREDKLIVTGLVSTGTMPGEKNEQKAWLNALVGAALDTVLADSSKGIAFVTPGRRIERGVPTMCEVRMKDKVLALAIRKEFAKKRRSDVSQAQAGVAKLFIANSVTLATRVRSDILWAIAKRCSNDNEDFFVVGFVSRPVLQIRRKDGHGQFALTFVDAISKFGSGLTRGELQVAYGRAGESFSGQLQQNFVVLHENGGAQNGAGGAGPTIGTGRKRGRDEMTSARRGGSAVRGKGNRRGNAKK